jgi:hypothetical protein
MLVGFSVSYLVVYRSIAADRWLVRRLASALLLSLVHEKVAEETMLQTAFVDLSRHLQKKELADWCHFSIESSVAVWDTHLYDYCHHLHSR